MRRQVEGADVRLRSAGGVMPTGSVRVRPPRYRCPGFGWLRAADRAALPAITLTVLMAALVVAYPVEVRGEPSRAAGGTVDLAQAIELVKREVAAVGTAGAPAGAPGALPDRTLQIEDIQLDFILVEVAGKVGFRMAVPTVDFGNAREAGREAGRDGTTRPSLRRRLTLGLRIPRPRGARAQSAAKVPAGPEAERSGDGSVPASVPIGARGADGQAVPASDAVRPLRQAILEIADAAHDATVAEPAFEARRLSIDLDFAIGRDARGAPALIVYAADRPIETRNVHKLRIRLATADRLRSAGRNASREPDPLAEPAPDMASARTTPEP